MAIYCRLAMDVLLLVTTAEDHAILLTLSKLSMH